MTNRRTVVPIGLDARIGRAEAACERYRRSAGEEGLMPDVARKRRAAWQRMEDMLAGLRAQRAAARR
jgi:hypothetical protein